MSNLIEMNFEESIINTNREVYFTIKRILDVIIASSLLFVLAPLYFLIAVLIKIDSQGPVIFVQSRVGSKRMFIAGKVTWHIYEIPFYKFRTMVQNADQAMHLSQIQAYVAGQTSLSETGSTKIGHDPRITNIGRFLRKTSLDELPQLVNVLKGEMSLVGPRPIPIYEFSQYGPQHYQRFYASQGITGLWQVMGRCTLSFEEQIELDKKYVQNQSLWLDAKILLRTIPAVISAKGAG